MNALDWRPEVDLEFPSQALTPATAEQEGYHSSWFRAAVVGQQPL